MLSVLYVVVALVLGGCAISREGQLRNKGEQVESKLSAERDKVLTLSADDPARQARLNRLNELRTELTAANLGITAAKLVPESNRDAAYDVVEQMYDTIEWNIPIPPGQKMRPLPKEYSGGNLQFR
jgi:DNA repair ATPase RecN